MNEIAAAYEKALAEFRAIATAHQQTREDYQALRIDDATFLTSAHALDDANARLDVAEAAYNTIEPINDPHLWPDAEVQP